MPSTSIPKPSREGRTETTAARLPSLAAKTQSPTVAEAEQKPWKYIGYKGYAEVIASEEDFFILRRFKATSVRVALSLQDQVAVLEEKLAALDEKYSQREYEDLHNGTFRQDEKERTDAIEKLRQKLVQYSECQLFKYCTVHPTSY
jgi:mannose-6-phosphate isomerase class I